MVVDVLPVLRGGRCIRPGVIRVHVQNVGDEADSAVIRLRVRGGRLTDAEALTYTLAPFATVEKRYELWAEAGKIHLAVTRDGVDGVVDTRAVDVADEAMTPWPAALQVSALQQDAGRLEALDRVPSADRLQWQSHAVDPASGFCNLHARLATVGEADALVWIGCRVRCPEAMRVAVLLGYDGPVKLFVDGLAVFHDPAGTNPARPDSAAPEVAFGEGEHELAVALGANQGHAWGVFLRLLRVDLGDHAPLILPEIHV